MSPHTYNMITCAFTSSSKSGTHLIDLCQSNEETCLQGLSLTDHERNKTTCLLAIFIEYQRLSMFVSCGHFQSFSMSFSLSKIKMNNFFTFKDVFFLNYFFFFLIVKGLKMIFKTTNQELSFAEKFLLFSLKRVRCTLTESI